MYFFYYNMVILCNLAYVYTGVNLVETNTVYPVDSGVRPVLHQRKFPQLFLLMDLCIVLKIYHIFEFISYF